MINLHNLQWMTRCLAHPDQDKESAIKMAHKAMELFAMYPALMNHYVYLYTLACKQSRQIETIKLT